MMAAPQRSSSGSAPERTSERRDQRSADGRGRDRRDRRGGDRRGGGDDRNYIERVVSINRVSKVVKGGRRFSFTALVDVGDGDGTVGGGDGKGEEGPAGVANGVQEAKED